MELISDMIKHFCYYNFYRFSSFDHPKINILKSKIVQDNKIVESLYLHFGVRKKKKEYPMEFVVDSQYKMHDKPFSFIDITNHTKKLSSCNSCYIYLDKNDVMRLIKEFKVKSFCLDIEFEAEFTLNEKVQKVKKRKISLNPKMGLMLTISPFELFSSLDES